MFYNRDPKDVDWLFEGRAGTKFLKTLLFVVVCSSLLLVGGCIHLGPDYQPPEAAVETNWLAPDDALVNSESPADPKWWHTAFQDPVLDQLVETALQQNLTLRSAGLRVLQSQQQLAIAIGNQFPQQQQATGAASRQKANAQTFNNYNLGFSLGWEADFWGRFSRQVESASAELDASVASYDGALLSMVSQVAQNYILILTSRVRIDVARENIRVNCVCPGDIQTPMLDREAAVAENPETYLAEMQRHYPIGRVGKPEEVAATICFLASQTARFVVGAAWSIDGGLTSYSY